MTHKLLVAITVLTICLLSNDDAKALIKTANLVGAWRFEGNANDWSGNANNGTVTGATLAAGKFGQCYSFDGVDDYVDATDNNLPTGNPSVTLSAWIKTTQTGEKYFFGWGTRGFHNEIVLGLYNGNFFVESYGGGKYGNTIVNDGVWHHVVGIWNGSDVIEYVDGVLQSLTLSGNMTGPLDIISSGHLNIGRLINYNGYYFNGSIDEVRIYNRALNAAEIRSLMLNYDPGEF